MSKTESFLQPLFIYTPLELLLAVLQIALIDLVLSGDNAAIIGMAICHLPHRQRRKAAIFGSLLAILLRCLFTVTAGILLQIPYLSAIGGLILLFITYRLINPKHEVESIATIDSQGKMLSAIAVIVAADASMAFDNVLGVAGAAEGMPLLICFGLLLSIPLLVWGASIAAEFMNKYPIILYVGAAILTHTSLHMLLNDEALGLYQLIPFDCDIIAWTAAGLVLIYGIIKISVQKN